MISTQHDQGQDQDEDDNMSPSVLLLQSIDVESAGCGDEERVGTLEGVPGSVDQMFVLVDQRRSQSWWPHRASIAPSKRFNLVHKVYNIIPKV